MTILEYNYDHLPCGVLVTNEFCEIIYCNNTFALQINLTTAELTGKNLDSLLSNGSKIFFQQIILPSIVHKNNVNEAQINFIDDNKNKIPMVIFANRDKSCGKNILWSCFSAVERNKLLDELNQSKNQLEEANSQLKILIKTDSLTGCYNRREMSLRLSIARRYAERRKLFFGILMLDLDHFKVVNDHHGHTEGDYVLKQVGKLVMDSARFDDTVARYGGEEFIIILPDIDIKGMSSIADRVHENMKKIRSKAGNITVSIGGCLVTHDTMADNSELIAMADHALYQSKKTGRNKTTLCSFPPLDTTSIKRA